MAEWGFEDSLEGGGWVYAAGQTNLRLHVRVERSWTGGPRRVYDTARERLAKHEAGRLQRLAGRDPVLGDLLQVELVELAGQQVADPRLDVAVDPLKIVLFAIHPVAYDTGRLPFIFWL